jgi:hypothetical protein
MDGLMDKENKIPSFGQYEELDCGGRGEKNAR